MTKEIKLKICNALQNYRDGLVNWLHGQRNVPLCQTIVPELEWELKDYSKMANLNVETIKFDYHWLNENESIDHLDKESLCKIEYTYIDENKQNKTLDYEYESTDKPLTMNITITL